MAQAFQLFAYLFGLPLELVVIALLLRGEYRRYPFIFLYAVADFVTTLAEIPVSAIAQSSGTPEAKRRWALMFWSDERIMQVLVFLLVISLVYKATEHLRPRRILLTGIICGTILVAAISWWHNNDPSLPSGKVMTPWTRDLNFCAAMLDLGLWVLLIGSREKDRKLLLITGALGIQFTGGAIGQALRDMSLVTAGNDFMVVANLARSYIWWQAFRSAPKARPAGNHTPK